MPTGPAPAIMSAAPAATASPAPSAPLSSAPLISSAGSSCGAGCDTCDACAKPKHVWFSRLFSKSSCDCGCAAPKPVVCETCKPIKAAPCETCEDPCKKHHGLLSKLFAPRAKAASCDTCSSCGGAIIASPTYGTPIKAVPATTLPSTSGPAIPSEPIPKPKEDASKPMPGKTTMANPPVLELAPAGGIVTESETKHPFELSRRYEKRVDRATDFSWITGQLFYVHADGGLWVLRYSPVGVEDAHGGGVILARDLRMESYREGDLVTVKGEILDQRGSLHLGAPLYRASDIELVERSER